MADNFDLIVIGAGPGGYVAAIRGAQLGMSVACVEINEGAGGFGGVCNNTGCIPTKAMLESAKYAKKAPTLAEYGVSTGEIKLDVGVAGKRAKKVAEQGNKGVQFLFKKNKIESVVGWGRLTGANTVEVEGADKKKRTLTGKNIIIATGSRPRSLPILKIDGDRVWSSDQAVFPTTAPATLGIIGAGAIGMEFADVYNAFGTKVTVIEALPQILPLEDKDCAAVVEKSYKKRGIEMMVGAKLEKAEVGKNGVKLTIAGKDGSKTLEVERVLVAVGRAPIIDDIGLEKAGVKTEKGFIVVDDHLQTTAKNIYAIGDVARPPLLAHKASHEGIAVVEHIGGVGHGMVDYNNIPSVTYCHPEVASVGLTEAAAREKGLDIEVGMFPWSANGRARTAGETDGFVKIIRDKKYSEILGAHIVGPSASELIAEFVVGRHLESTVEEMEKAMHPHPTLSEAIAEAALAAVGRVIHI
ncbi:MAG TPA: dihydrolipoyl dehydrogenase [Longimicrobiales bacterium]|nr:dihydrolipoyl dehydrogenase [Longimicrobiales bacterium]